MLNFIDVQVGQRLRLRDGRMADVTENIGDGIWLQVRFVPADGATVEDEEDLLHCEEVLDLVEPD